MRTKAYECFLSSFFAARILEWFTSFVCSMEDRQREGGVVMLIRENAARKYK